MSVPRHVAARFRRRESGPVLLARSGQIRPRRLTAEDTRERDANYPQRRGHAPSQTAEHCAGDPLSSALCPAHGSLLDHV